MAPGYFAKVGDVAQLATSVVETVAPLIQKGAEAFAKLFHKSKPINIKSGSDIVKQFAQQRGINLN